MCWALLFGAATTAAAETGAPPTECDQLVAHPVDPQRVTDGINFEDINTDRAIAACRAALSQFPDSARISFQLGRAYDAKGDSGAAEEFYRRAGELGSAAAKSSLASLLSGSSGYPMGAQRQPEVARLLEEASRAGHPEAQRALGVMLLGNSTPEDDARGMQLLTSAAEAGYPLAQYELGFRYLKGDGAEQDITRGIEWLTKAADNNQVSASALLGTLREDGIGVARSYSRAAELYRSAAEQGNAYAQYRLGNLYYLGLGTAQNDQEAIAWLTRAAEGGEIESYRLLAHINFYSYHDVREAFRWWIKAIDAGDKVAAEKLLTAYFIVFSNPDRYGLRDDLREQVDDAIATMQKLARQGNTLAQIDLGMFYRDGLGGIAKVPERARYWFQQAADAGDEDARKALAELEK